MTAVPLQPGTTAREGGLRRSPTGHPALRTLRGRPAVPGTHAAGLSRVRRGPGNLRDHDALEQPAVPAGGRE